MQNEYTYESNGNELKEEGDYEVRVEKMEVRVLPSGTEKLFVQYRIRDDVEQKYKNACLFEDIWHEKENPNLFNRKRINRMLGTQEIKEGTVFASINKICDFMIGQNLIVHLVKQYDDYKGEEINSIAYYKKTNSAPKKLGSGTPTPQPQPKNEEVEINDEDLPF